MKAAVLVLLLLTGAALAQPVRVGRIEGRVVTADGRPVAAAVVKVAGEVPYTATSDAGRFGLTVAAGDREIWTERGGARSRPVPVTVAHGDLTRVELVLSALDCSDAARRVPSAVERQSLRVPGLVAIGRPRICAGPVVTQVAVGGCVGDPDLDRVELLRRAGWDRATPGERELLAIAWVADVLYAFDAGAGTTQAPSARTLPTGVVVVDCWHDFAGHLERPTYQLVEWRLTPDGDLAGPMVLKEIRISPSSAP